MFRPSIECETVYYYKFRQFFHFLTWGKLFGFELPRIILEKILVNFEHKIMLLLLPTLCRTSKFQSEREFSIFLQETLSIPPFCNPFPAPICEHLIMLICLSRVQGRISFKKTSWCASPNFTLIELGQATAATAARERNKMVQPLGFEST